MTTDRDAPFFIIGSGRSGTTLLRLVLTGHSRLHIPPETWFILPLVEQLPLTGALTAAQVDRAVSIITSHRRWPAMGITAEALTLQASALRAPTLVDVIGLPFAEHLRRAGKPRFGDKTPPYIGIVPQLATLYPGSRFIHLIRDGRDVAISFNDANFHGRAYHGRDFEWTRAIRLGIAYRDSPHAERILDVRYEAMVRDLEGTMRGICAFLGESFEPAMLDWRDRVETIPDVERSIHLKLERPVSDDAIAVWRRKLSGAECFMIEASLHRELRAMGYPLRFASPAWRPLFDAARPAMRAMSPRLDRAARSLRRRGYLERAIYL